MLTPQRKSARLRTVVTAMSLEGLIRDIAAHAKRIVEEEQFTTGTIVMDTVQLARWCEQLQSMGEDGTAEALAAHDLTWPWSGGKTDLIMHCVAKMHTEHMNTILKWGVLLAFTVYQERHRIPA